jgi:hypothetical protein
MIALLLLLAQAWVESSIIGVPTESSKHPLVVYVWGAGAEAEKNIPTRVLAPDRWHTIDLADPSMPVNNIPADTNAIELGGLLGSSGQPSVICGLVANFRAPGATMEALNYQIQGAAMPGAGFRANASVMVPVRDRRFEFWWHTTDPACPMFLSLSVQWYARGGVRVVTPPPPAPMLTVTVTTSTLTVSVLEGPGGARDWVSLYPADSNNFLEWQYLNGLQVPPVLGIPTTVLTFRRPAPGRYTVMLFSSALGAFVARHDVVVP